MVSKMFHVRFEMDEAFFLVEAVSETEAYRKWAKNRKLAGCGKLPREETQITEVVFDEDGVSQPCTEAF